MLLQTWGEKKNTQEGNEERERVSWLDRKLSVCFYKGTTVLMVGL